jgi:hypothetical protein
VIVAEVERVSWRIWNEKANNAQRGGFEFEVEDLTGQGAVALNDATKR